MVDIPLYKTFQGLFIFDIIKMVIGMDQEKIGKLIRDIRIKNHMSQQQFAEKYNVTYQAVSKWENGKNMPDIAILKQICEDYHMNLSDLLDVKKTKKNHPKKWMIGSIVIIFVLFLVLLIFLFTRQDGFEFKKLTASCDDFTLYGSIAYTESKSSIYISNISYCGEEDKQKYQELLCILYEEDGKSKTEISRYHYQESEPITIEKFASIIELHVDHYENTCNISEDDSLHLEIEATDLDGKITTYKIPLTLSDHCD